MSAAGELLIEQPSQDTLQVILSGHWKLVESLRFGRCGSTKSRGDARGS